MSVSLRDFEAEAFLAVLALPEDDWQPEHWSTWCAFVMACRDLPRRIERDRERRSWSGWERADGPKVKVASRKRPKPDPPELVAAKAEVRARSMGRCEAHVSGWCSFEAGHAHHVLGRGQGGAHTAENLADVCPNCHSKIHANPDWARRHGLMRSPGGPLIAPVAGCSLSCEVDHRPIAGPA